MNTITVTCPADGEQFAVVEPEDQSQFGSLTATCPRCNERFAIVYPDELRKAEASTPPYEPYSLASIEDWEPDEDPPAPYTGSEKAIPYEQYITAKIGALGGPPNVTEGSPSHVEAMKPDRFQIWYTPEHDEIAYVARANLETGVKTKNVYSHGTSLYVKNRGVPRNSDKQWTFLDRDECYARAAQADLPGEITEADDKEGRYNILLESSKQPLYELNESAEDGDEEYKLADELVLELARMLVAFQTKRIR